MKMNTKNRAEGMLLGLAIGDALGAPVEFLPTPSDFYIAEMGDKIEHYHKNHRMPEGVWTDDTSMALCLADSILENGGYDSYDIMCKFHNWAYYKYRAHPNAPIDVGMQTLRALDDYQIDPVIPKDAPKTQSAGNGCIMRLAPIIIANVFDTQNHTLTANKINPVLNMASLSCRETHNSIMAETVTQIFASMLYAAMLGLGKNTILDNSTKWITNSVLQETASKVHKEITQTLDKDSTSLCNLGGYCLDALRIATWGFMCFNSFKDGMLAVIRLGGDTDTNAAIYGQLAGAYYGSQNIPSDWISGLYLHGEIQEIAHDLLQLKQCPILYSRFADDKNFKRKDQI